MADGAPRLRIHFTADDLVRAEVRPIPDALWELVLSLHHLHHHPARRHRATTPAEVARWRGDALAALSGRPAAAQVRSHLLPLAPISSYWPDFLTPEAGRHGLEAGLEAVGMTPRRRVGRELDILTSRNGAPSWGRDLATDSRGARRLLEQAMRDYFDTALAPRWLSIGARVAVEHTRLTGIQTREGIEGVLSGLRPTAVWDPADRVLHAVYPMSHNVRLNGRGLTLIPSWFCSRTPVVLADPDLPPVLVYPLTHDPLPRARPDALARLLGPTRAAILAAITVGTPARALRTRIPTSPAQLSRHATVLRDNNLIVQARHAGQTFYSRTALGDAIVSSPPH